MSDRVSSLGPKLESARKELLDLGLHNPLINYRPLKSKGLQIVDELPPQVFRLLVTEGRPAYFLPVPGTPAQESLIDESLVGEEPLGQPNGQKASDARHTDNKLQTTLTSAQLQTRLLSTYYAAHSSIEEQGVNILYLALGMLEWYESDDSQDVRRAPLILVPVTLERASVSERFQLSYDGEDLEENLSLREKLRELGLKLPAFPDEDELDVTGYFSEVQRAVRAERRWRVDDSTVALGFFSFSKLLMYRDLDPYNWPSECPLESHPILVALLEDGFRQDDIAITEEDYLDDKVDPDELPTVVDADSSQMLTLLRARAGLNLVVQGPPGTGKSQTIANLIANAITSGKTVLFVSEKMAALEVVKRRLDQIGIGDACLELHSHKANKRMLLEELQRTLGLGKPRAVDTQADAAERRETQVKLDDYCRALNTPIGDSAVTPYQALGYLATTQRLQAADELIGIPVKGMAAWSATEFRRKRALVEELQEELQSTGVPCRHPFWRSERTRYLPEDEQHVREALCGAQEALLQLRVADGELAQALGISSSESCTETERLVRTAERVLEAPDLHGIQLASEDWVGSREKLLGAISSGAVLQELHLRFDHQLKLGAWDFDTTEVRQALDTLGPKWWHSMSAQYRAARKQAGGLFRGDSPKDIESVGRAMQAIAQAQVESKKLEATAAVLATLFGSQWAAGKPDWAHLKKCVNYLATAHSDVSAGSLSDELWIAIEHGADPGVVKSLTDHARASLTTWRSRVHDLADSLQVGEAVEFEEQACHLDYEPSRSRLEEWIGRQAQLHDLVKLNEVLALCDEKGLGSLRGLVSAWDKGGERTVDSFVRTWYLTLYQRAFAERPSLAKFDRERHDRYVSRYQSLDRLVVEHTRAQIAMAHWQRLPAPYAIGQMGVLMREFEKKRRHLPIRQLLTQAGGAIQLIKPVLMMSPLSVAAYLAPGSVSFDLVVFDEASQVKPVDALGALVRANQAVVVGDDHQLPPTSFFDAITQADEEDESDMTSDIESILGLFRSQGANQSMLRWHYRSRHQSLIAVSNHEFYKDKLVVFPSPDGDSRTLGLVYNYVADGAYDRGRSRRNEKEASVVAEAVMDHAREQLTKPASEQHTLGVAAFSMAQMDAILDHLERLRRRDDSCEDYFRGHPHEPFFVKNLENVQGDERDVIFISVGYGRTAEGYIAMDFGPVNREGGERRLNVLITRARRRCEVFTNLTADDIDLSRSKQRGVRALKTFLDYAESGRLGVPTPAERDDESPFEDAVWDALTGRGYEVTRQVGTGGFYIDLAVKDPDKPGRYLLGIECDGATYHSARSARDRDRLRQQVLEGLGWRIHRIWSTSWFRNEDKEIARLEEAIQAAKLGQRVDDRSGLGPLANAKPVDREPSESEPDAVPPEMVANVTIHGYGHGSDAGTAFEAGYRDAVASRVGGGRYESPRLGRAYDKGYEWAIEALRARDATSGSQPESPKNPNGMALPKYTVCSLDVRLRGMQLHELPTRELADWVQQIVDVESPIHIDEICWRIAEAVGVARVGNRIRTSITRACALTVMERNVTQKGDFYWKDHGAAPEPRDRSDLPLRSRRLELVADEEIAAVIARVAERSCGVNKDEIPPAACSLLGFGRCSADMKARVDAVLATELRNGRLEEQRGQIVSADQDDGRSGNRVELNLAESPQEAGQGPMPASRPSSDGRTPRPGDPEYYGYGTPRL